MSTSHESLTFCQAPIGIAEAFLEQMQAGQSSGTGMIRRQRVELYMNLPEKHLRMNFL